MRMHLLRIVALAGLLYLLLCGYVFLAQRSMMYVPTRMAEPACLRRGLALGLTPWRDGRGAFIGWRAPGARGPAEARALVFCGNAGNALDRLGYVLGLQDPAVARRWEVLILEYPGYGSRPGEPSEASLVAAGLEALDLLEGEGRLPTVLVGESLGSGVAALCAARRPDRVQGLFLLTPLNRMRDVAAAHYPFLPPILVKDRFEAADALQAWRGPLALMVAERDEVIPARLGRKLFEGYAGPKRLWTAPGAGHNDWDGGPANPLWREASAFLAGP
jgi:pimeloyl-ACP methyl ester carboxylesterase